MNGITADEFSVWCLLEADAFAAAFPSTLSPVLLQGFVLTVTVIREAAEEIRCYMRDKEVNSQIYSKLTGRGQCWVGCVGLCWELVFLSADRSDAGTKGGRQTLQAYSRTKWAVIDACCLGCCCSPSFSVLLSFLLPVLLAWSQCG